MMPEARRHLRHVRPAVACRSGPPVSGAENGAMTDDVLCALCGLPIHPKDATIISLGVVTPDVPDAHIGCYQDALRDRDDTR